MLRYLSQLGNTDLYNSSVVILSLIFHSSYIQCCPLGSSYLVGRVLSISLQNPLSFIMVRFLIYFHCFCLCFCCFFCFFCVVGYPPKLGETAKVYRIEVALDRILQLARYYKLEYGSHRLTVYLCHFCHRDITHKSLNA